MFCRGLQIQTDLNEELNNVCLFFPQCQFKIDIKIPVWRTRFEMSCGCLHFKHAWLTNIQDKLKNPVISTKYCCIFIQHDNEKDKYVEITYFLFVLKLEHC